MKFQFNQLDEARLREGEQQELEEELAVLNNAENIKSAFSESTYVLTESDNPVIQALKGYLYPSHNYCADFPMTDRKEA